MGYIFSSKTVIWKISIVEQNKKISHLFLKQKEIPNIYEYKATPLLKEAFFQLEKYLEWKIKNFSLPLNPQGTVFMKSVWEALQKIPYGKTKSYKEIAEIIGNPKAIRAVGMANNKNPIAIFIPCHRVIGHNGSLVGYGWWLEIKKKLLKLEGVKIKE